MVTYTYCGQNSLQKSCVYSMNMQVYWVECGFSWQAAIKMLNIMPTDSISGKKHEDADLVSIYSADENI